MPHGGGETRRSLSDVLIALQSTESISFLGGARY
jgi:hypothetical protein